MKTMQQFHSSFWNASLQVLAAMERRGITLDVDYLESRLPLAQETIDELNRKLQHWARDYVRQREDLDDLNWNSNQQVCEFLYEFKGFPITPVFGTKGAAKKNSKRKPSSSEAALQWLATNTSYPAERENLKALLDLKTVTKLAQFLVKLPQSVSSDQRLRCSIGPNTDTGRLSSSKPNLQQIPTRNDRYGIRRAFRAAPGKRLVVADYSQLEMYVIAHFLLHVLNDDSLARDLASGDVHTNTAFRIWGKELEALGATHETIKDKEITKRYRSDAKTVNYAVPYGKTATGLGMQITDQEGKAVGTDAAQQILNEYFAAYPGLDRLFEGWRSEARATGYVRTLLGRTRPLVNINLPPIEAYGKTRPDWRALADERRAVNTPVQGSAADIVTAAMLRTNTKKLPMYPEWYNQELAETGAELILQVHDELIFEVAEEHADQAAQLVKSAMENPFKKPLKVPLKVDVEVGETWGDCK